MEEWLWPWAFLMSYMMTTCSAHTDKRSWNKCSFNCHHFRGFVCLGYRVYIISAMLSLNVCGPCVWMEHCTKSPALHTYNSRFKCRISLLPQKDNKKHRNNKTWEWEKSGFATYETIIFNTHTLQDGEKVSHASFRAIFFKRKQKKMLSKHQK